MAAAGEVLTGERVVVLLFVARVAYASPFPFLAAEVAALLALSAAGLLLDIVVDLAGDSRRFKTRPGASSGILLGAVTLPSVMLSRIIQLSRMSLDVNGSQELRYLQMQYWVVHACCFCALPFFLMLAQRSARIAHSRLLMLTVTVAVISAVTCFMSLALKITGGYMSTSIMTYLLFHGLATVALIQHALQKFPGCASFGETLLVSSGLVLYFGGILAHTISKVGIFFVQLEEFSRISHSQSEINNYIQGVLFGLFMLPLFYKSVLRVWVHLSKLAQQHWQAVDESGRKSIGTSLIFYTSLVVMLCVIVPAWMDFVLGVHVHPLTWVLKFVFTDPLVRLALCAYWIFVIWFSVVRFYKISKHSKTERILLRKYYHLVAVLLFLPAVILQPAFLDLAFGAALSAFIVLEMIRIWKLWPLGDTVNQFMNAFTDHRDSEILIISHFSLLLGCALPKWMSAGRNDRPLTPFAGILSLGIGDTMASMIGYKYGVLRWSKSGKKTIEGTAAGITSVLAACSVLLPLLASSGYILSQHWCSLLMAVTLSGLLEAYTAQLDNAFIPLMFYSLLCL